MKIIFDNPGAWCFLVTGLCGKKDDKEKVDFKEDLEGFVQDWKVDEKCSDLG